MPQVAENLDHPGCAYWEGLIRRVQQAVEYCSVAPCGRRKTALSATYKGWRYTRSSGNDFFNRLLAPGFRPGLIGPLGTGQPLDALFPGRVAAVLPRRHWPSRPLLDYSTKVVGDLAVLRWSGVCAGLKPSGRLGLPAARPADWRTVTLPG